MYVKHSIDRYLTVTGYLTLILVAILALLHPIPQEQGYGKIIRAYMGRIHHKPDCFYSVLIANIRHLAMVRTGTLY